MTYLMSPVICLSDTCQWFYELPCDRLEENFVRMLSNIKKQMKIKSELGICLHKIIGYIFLL